MGRQSEKNSVEPTGGNGAKVKWAAKQQNKNEKVQGKLNSFLISGVNTSSLA